jgi:hypothetical protein
MVIDLTKARANEGVNKRVAWRALIDQDYFSIQIMTLFCFCFVFDESSPT